MCYGISCRKEAPCLVCGKPILAGLNKKTCSRSCANKHRQGIKYKLNSPKDKVKTQGLIKIRLLKIRGKKCERCGFDKYEILEIHHKDKNRNNNNLDNLELICPNCHSEKHYLDKSWIGNVINSRWGTEVVITGRSWKPLVSQGARGFESHPHRQVLIAQWIERLVAVQKVAGSIPAKDTNYIFSRYISRGLRPQIFVAWLFCHFLLNLSW